MAAAVISSLVFCLIILFISHKVVYNLYFHPLARFPGPSLWCASRIPYLWKLCRGKLPGKIRAYHDKYGPVVRIAPDELSFDDPAAWREIYSDQTLDQPSLCKTKPTGSFMENLIFAHAEIQPRMRDALHLALSEASVDKYEPIVTRVIDRLVAKLKSSLPKKKDDSSTLNIVRCLELASFDIAAEVVCGGSVEGLESGEGNIVLEYALSCKEKLIATVITFYPFLAFLSPLLFLSSAKSTAIQLFKRKTTERLSRYQETSSGKQGQPDVLGSILQSQASEKLPVTALEQTSVELVTSGSGPIVAVLIGTLNYLLRNPSKYDHLIQEIRGSFKRETDINGSAIRSLPYLHAVVTEGLRIAPPVPDGLRRVVSAGGLAVAGCSVPPKTIVSTGCWVQFMNPRNFACPEEFVPERWLHAKGTGGIGGRTIVDTANKDAFYPFGLGARQCLGEPLAWLELKLALARLLWNFDISISSGKSLPVWAEQDVFWCWNVQPMEVSLRLCRRF
ncbi:cytochrome P450 [Aspergillus floccosus]